MTGKISTPKFEDFDIYFLVSYILSRADFRTDESKGHVSVLAVGLINNQNVP